MDETTTATLAADRISVFIEPVTMAAAATLFANERHIHIVCNGSLAGAWPFTSRRGGLALLATAPGGALAGIGALEGGGPESRLTLAIGDEHRFDEFASPLFNALVEAARERGCQRIRTLVECCGVNPYRLFSAAGLTVASSLQVGGAAEVTLEVGPAAGHGE